MDSPPSKSAFFFETYTFKFRNLYGVFGICVEWQTSVIHYRLMMFDYMRPFRLQKGIIIPIWWHKKFSVIAIFLDTHTQTIWALQKAQHWLIWFCLYFGCWKRIFVTKIIFGFAHNVNLCNSVTFRFWVTLEFSRRHCNRITFSRPDVVVFLRAPLQKNKTKKKQ